MSELHARDRTGWIRKWGSLGLPTTQLGQSTDTLKPTLPTFDCKICISAVLTVFRQLPPEEEVDVGTAYDNGG